MLPPYAISSAKHGKKQKTYHSIIVQSPPLGKNNTNYFRLFCKMFVFLENAKEKNRSRFCIKQKTRTIHKSAQACAADAVFSAAGYMRSRSLRMMEK